MKKILDTLGKATFLVVVIVVSLLVVDYVRPQVEKVADDTFGSRFASRTPITIIGWSQEHCYM